MFFNCFKKQFIMDFWNKYSVFIIWGGLLGISLAFLPNRNNNNDERIKTLEREIKEINTKLKSL